MKVIRVYKTEVFTVEIELYMFTTGKKYQLLFNKTLYINKQ